MSVVAALPELPALVEPATSINGRSIRVKPRVNLGELTPNNLGTVRKLHNCLFPVSYSPHFFASVLDRSLSPEEYNQLAYYQDLPVGVLITRLEPVDKPSHATLADAAGAGESRTPVAGGSNSTGVQEEQKDEGKEGEGYKLYVMTLGVLAPYRRQGLASKLIHHLLTSASSTHVSPPSSVASITPTPTPSSSSKKSKKPPAPLAVNGKKDSEKSDAKKEKEEEVEPARPRIESIYLHVQVGNDEARQFWEKWGFEVKETVKDYYRKITPRDAWLLERKVGPMASSA
ncbi:hypothetical protein JCM11641_005759 [Rhodosporidiobolus odoratus]